MKLATLKHRQFIDAFEASLPPAPVNPFKAARNDLDLTMAELAKRTGVTKQSIVRLEQGTFAAPLDKVAQFFTDQGYSYLSLRDAYIDYQTQQRARHHRMFGNFVVKLSQCSTSEHPFRHIREPFTPTYVAKALCISQASIEHFENRVARQTIVPQALQDVLNEIGYARSEVGVLNSCYHDYRLVRLSRG